MKSTFGPLPDSGHGWPWPAADKVGLVLCWNAKVWKDEMEGSLSVSSDGLWVPLHCPLYSEGNGAPRRSE